MQARQTSVIAFFGGTGCNFPAFRKGSVTERQLGNRKKNIDGGDDDSYSLLSDCLADNQTYFGYNGCHLRGGGTFSFGIHQPGDHLYLQVKAIAADHENVKVILTAFSRGCLSALYFCRLVADDPYLAAKLDIVLDLHDPVPGNFRISTLLDKAMVSTSAGQTRDFRDTTCVKEAHVTVLEAGMLPFCFNTMIPKFPTTTKMEVEFLPGIHDIMQRDQLNAPPQYNNKEHYLHQHEAVYLLGLLKSLQIYAENGVQLFTNCEDEFRGLNLKVLYEKAGLTEVVEKILSDPNPEHYRGELIEKLQLAQAKLYDELLKYYRENPEHLVKTRHLHFGGKCSEIGDKDKANVFNTRHAGLLDTLGFLVEPVPYVGYIGKRVDIGFRDMLETRYEALIRTCMKYRWKLPDEENQKHLDELLEILRGRHFDTNNMMERVDSFTHLFMREMPSLNSDVANQFRDDIRKILDSISKLGLKGGICTRPM